MKQTVNLLMTSLKWQIKLKIDFIKLKVNTNSCAKRKLDLVDECERLMLESAMLQSELTRTNDAKLGQLFEFHEFVYKECISLLHDAKRQFSLVNSEALNLGMLMKCLTFLGNQ